MEICKVTAENFIHFRNMAPDIFWTKLGKKGIYHIGAYSSVEDTDDVMPVGILIFSVYKRESEFVSQLQWIFVPSDFARQDVGTRLLAEWRRVCRETEIEKMHVMLDENQIELQKTMEFSGFRFTPSAVPHVRLPLIDIYEKKELAGRKMPGGCMPFSQLKAAEKAGIIQRASAKHDSLRLLPGLEENLSFVYMEGRQIQGTILVSPLTPNNPSIVYLRGEGRGDAKVILAVMKAAAVQARMLYTSDTMIDLVCYDEYSMALVNYLFPESESVTMLVGEAKAILK